MSEYLLSNFEVNDDYDGYDLSYLAIKYLSYLVDKGLDVILDDYWRDRLNKFKGFGNE